MGGVLSVMRRTDVQYTATLSAKLQMGKEGAMHLLPDPAKACIMIYE